MYTIRYSKGAKRDFRRWLGSTHETKEAAIDAARRERDADAGLRASVLDDGGAVAWSSHHWALSVLVDPENITTAWYETGGYEQAVTDAKAAEGAGDAEVVDLRDEVSLKLVRQWSAKKVREAAAEKARIAEAQGRVVTLAEAREMAGSIDGKEIRIEADGQDLLVIAHRAPGEDGDDKVVLQGCRAGSITVVGDAWCYAVRRGSGFGHAIRYGGGIGGAWREGSGDGMACVEGGSGDARRIGSGNGSAYLQDGSGFSVRDGSGRGDAYWQGSGHWRISGVVRKGTGRGVGVAYREGEGGPAGARRVVQEIRENLDLRYNTVGPVAEARRNERWMVPVANAAGDGTEFRDIREMTPSARAQLRQEAGAAGDTELVDRLDRLERGPTMSVPAQSVRRGMSA